MSNTTKENIACVVIILGLGSIAGTLAYFDVQMRYAFLAIGLIGGSAILGTSILGGTAALIRYWKDKNQPFIHTFETDPPKPETWKENQ